KIKHTVYRTAVTPDDEDVCHRRHGALSPPPAPKYGTLSGLVSATKRACAASRPPLHKTKHRTTGPWCPLSFLKLVGARTPPLCCTIPFFDPIVYIPHAAPPIVGNVFVTGPP
ncbi:unnamed protein product, partial [Ectocarpus sp. 8 AP-2014]